MTTYFHGGVPGLRVGQYLLPPTITKSKSLSDYGAAEVHRTDRVYVTTRKSAALIYAASVKNGVIYECEPAGEIEPDPDCSLPGLSWQCEKAKVLRIIKLQKADIDLARMVLLSGSPGITS